MGGKCKWHEHDWAMEYEAEEYSVDCLNCGKHDSYWVTASAAIDRKDELKSEQGEFKRLEQQNAEMLAMLKRIDAIVTMSCTTKELRELIKKVESEK